MIVSFVIPAFQAGQTIGETLRSVFAAPLPQGWSLDVLVANDASPDDDAQRAVVETFGGVKYLSHSPNQGKCAAMNLAIPHTRGAVVILLDADDGLVQDWATRLCSILETWPAGAPLCFSACRTQDGESTVSQPDYSGPLSLHDILNERHMGEYLPMFRGDALRAQGYRDPEQPYGCELWTYLGFAEHAELWISAEVLRIYRTDRPDAISATIYNRHTAAQVARCYDLVFADFAPAYRTHAPRNFARRRLRQAVFTALSGHRARAFQLWRQAARRDAFWETLAALALIISGPTATNIVVGLAKKARLLRRFG